MRQCYTKMIEKHTVKTLWTNLYLVFLLAGVLGLQTPLFAQSNCVVEIEDVNVSCNYSNGQSTFTASVEISWSGGATGAVDVSLGGQTQTVQLPGTSGSITLQGFTLPAPGYGYSVVAALANGSCQVFAQVDAIACTPACPDNASAIGGFVFKDENYNGSIDGEPGQPNILVEAYDCDGQLAGSAYSNANGLWSIDGLQDGQAYRLEFSADGNMGATFFGEQHTGDVQFAEAGNCGITAGFTPQVTVEDCVNPDNVADQCIENFRTLDWSEYSAGALPFPVAPYAQNIGGDNIYWSRSSDDATDYTHRVFHDMLGGEEAYYYLEMDADETDGSAPRDVGVVFALDRPVQRLNFSLLDIDISGDAIDRVSVQGYLGGMPVDLQLGDVEMGSAVNRINPGVFEGTTTVDGPSARGNVFIHFSQVVDQVAITFTASGAAVSDPGIQAIGIGNISWCDGPAQVEPLCARFLDWMNFDDAESNPLPYSIDGMQLSMNTNDPDGITDGVEMAVDNGNTAAGGQRGFWPLAMDATEAGQAVEQGFSFELPVEQLSFGLLGIDYSANKYHDNVEVRAFLNGVEVPFTLSDVAAGSGADDGLVNLMNANEYEAGGRTVNSVSDDGNVYISVPGKVDSFFVRLTTGSNSPENPELQMVGISDLQFCICKPAPIQIGDYVWEDRDGDGVQDACEPPLAGLAVQLFNGEGELLATTTTDANGRYRFTEEGAVGENWTSLTQLLPNNDYYLLFGEEGDNPDNQFVQAGDRSFQMTAALQGVGNNSYMNDSNPEALTNDMPGDIPNGLPYVAFSTGSAGMTNFTLDAGFQELYFDLAISMALDSTFINPPFLPGQEVTYLVTIHNQGLLTAEAIRFVNYKPQALQLVDGGTYHQTANLYQMPAIAPGDSLSTSITFRINPDYPGGGVRNAFEIVQSTNQANYPDIDSDGDAIDGNDADGEDDYTALEIQVEPALLFDLALKKELVGQGTFELGDQVSFEITVVNEGILQGTDIQIRDIVPEGLQLNDDNWVMDGAQAVLTTPIPELNSGESATRTINFTITQVPAGGAIVNRAEILSFVNFPWTDDEDSTPENDLPEEDDQDEAIVNVTSSFDLSLDKTVVSFGPYSEGSTVTYEITVTNEGGIEAKDVQIMDVIPAGLSLSSTSWQIEDGGYALLVTPIESIASGESVSRLISFTIQPGVTSANITNWAEILEYRTDTDAVDTDSTPGNQSQNEDDDDSAVITIVQSQPFMDLSLTKEVSTSGPYFYDQIVTFNITVTNEGNVPAYNIMVADHIPAGLELVDPNWMPLANLAVMPAVIDYLAPGDSEVLTIDFNISPAAPLGQIENYAEIYAVSNSGGMYDIDSSPGNGINNGEDDEDVAYLEVSGTASNFDLSLKKRVNTNLTPGPFAPGDEVTFELEITNEGLEDAIDVQVGDLIPSGLTLNDNDWVPSDLFGDIVVLDQPIASISAGSSHTVNITFTIEANYAGNTINNQAEIVRASNAQQLPDDDSTPANANTAEDDYDNELINIQQNLDLALSKTVLTPGPYEAGDQVTYELTVYNQGAVTATDIEVFDYYPTQQLLLSDTDWEAVSGNILRLADPIPSLAAGASVAVPITFTIKQIPCGATITNCAEIGGTSNTQQDDDSVPANGSHYEDDDDAIDITTSCTQAFDLSLEKTVAGGTTYSPGSTVTFDITVTNEGEVTAENISLQDYVPAGLVLVDPNWNGSGSVVSLNTPIASLEPGNSATVSITFAISAGLSSGALVNEAEIVAAGNVFNLDDEDSTPGNGSAGPNEDDFDKATIYIQQQSFDLALSKSLNTSVTPGPFMAGSPVTFTISVINQGSVTAQNIQLREYFPAGLQINDADWMAVGNVAELLSPIASLAPGATATVDVSFVLGSSFGGNSLTNYAEVGSAFNTIGLSDQDSTPGNGSLGAGEDDYDGATISVLQQNFDLALSKSVNTSVTPGPFTPGGSVTYVISVTNQGAVTAQGIELRDYIPLGLSLNDNDWTTNGFAAIYNNTIDNLQPGETTSVNITFDISPAYTNNTIVNFAEIGAAANSFGLPDEDSTPANGSASPDEDDYDGATITLSTPQNFDLALSKSVNTSVTPGPFQPGSLVTYTLTVVNQGSVAAQNIELRDYIPLGLNLMDNDWTPFGTTAILDDPIASLAPGASVSRDITFEISTAFPGDAITNYGEIGAASNTLGLPDEDSTPSNGSAGDGEDDFDGAVINVIPSENQDVFDLALHKSVTNAGPYQPGELVTFDITVTNEGNVTATGIQIQDYVPSGMLLADLDWSPLGGTALLSAPIASLAPNASVTVSIDLVVSPDFTGSSITNNAEIKAASNGSGLSDEDSTPDNGLLGSLEDDFDSATISVSQDDFDLALSKSVATAGPFAPGTPVSFQLTVTNQGSIEAQQIKLQDFVPNGLMLISGDWTQNGNIATLDSPIASLAPGQTVSVTIDFVVDPTFQGASIVNFAEILDAINTQGLDDTDSTPGNGNNGGNEDDYDNAVISVSQESSPGFDLALTKVVSTPGPYTTGGIVTFTVTVINQGDFDAYNVEVIDYIPAGFNLQDVAWTQTGSNARRTIPGPIAAAGGTASIDITFEIDPNYTGAAITNFAEISFADDDQILGNTPPTDVDSQYDSDNTNDAGGAPNTPADNATMGNGMGAPGSSLAVMDEDDHDPAMIVLDNCTDLNAGFDGDIKLCLSCDPAVAEIDLFGALGGNPSQGGVWVDNNNTGVNLMDPTAVDVAGLPNGIYTYTYIVGGMGICPQDEATVTLEIEDIGGYACNDQVNLNFGTGCEVTVTPDMILEGTDECMDYLEVELFGPGGVNLGNTVTGDQIGQLLFAVVIDPFCGQLCDGTVFVNDITSPGVICPTQTETFICEDIDSILNNPASLAFTGEPVILDNCSEFSTYTFSDTEAAVGDCGGQQIDRVFTVTDPAGNTTQCTQEITIEDPSLGDVVPPFGAPELSCDASFPTDQDGYPLPSVTGYPIIQGFYGDYILDQTACNLGATYEDTPFIQVCEGTNKFVRNWTVIDWCAPAGENVLTFEQLIKIGDTTGPDITVPSDTITFSTSAFSCTASFNVPAPIQVTDNCSSWEVSTEVLVDEIVPITNQFGQVVGYDTVETVVASIAPGGSPFVSGIPIGCHTIRYTATDDCGNGSVAEAPLCVEDQIEPTAVCDDDLNISLGGQGVAILFAEDVDEGSNDNCGIDTMLVRRLYEASPSTCADTTDYYSEWGESVLFNCCDVNQMVTIELKVIDIYGNENICWLEVLIEDKLNPYCFAPNDQSLSCADIPAGFNPMDTLQLQNLFGNATVDDNCSNAYIQELEPIVNLDNCGGGTIVRRFQAVDAQGNTSTNNCDQLISISDENNYVIKFPADVVSDCGVPDVDPLFVEGFGCDNLLTSVESDTLVPVNGNAAECYIIRRVYKVLNDCEYDGSSDPIIVGRNEDCDSEPGDEAVWVVRTPTTTFIDRDDNPGNTNPAFGTKGTSCDGNTNPMGYWRTSPSVGYWQYTQFIKVMDGTAPEVNFTQPDQFCSIDEASCNAAVQYPFTVVENCSPDDLMVTVELDANADGSVDFDVTQLVMGSYPNYTITGEYPIGSHQFIVTVQDGCGNNTNTAVLPFDVVDCLPPSFTCLNGVSFNLQELPPNTDIDGDGDFDVAGAGIWASDFHTSVSDCSDDTIAFSINLPGETPDINQTSLYFTCEDVGLVDVEVYFWDSAFNPEAVQPDGTVGGPNWDFCETFLYITDNNNLCSQPLQNPMMAGLISRENSDAVEAVEVALSGQMSTMMMTSVNGTYQFDDLPMGDDYTVTPSRDDDHRNGVSTFDLILIQQHLLGMSPFSSPYKMIAADVNNTGSITTLDMIQIQQLILGITSEFPSNTSWRFVEEDFSFPVPNNPWFTPFPEAITINNLAVDNMSNDFVAIKVGDVNNSAQTTALSAGTGIENRSLSETFYLRADDQVLQAGTTVEVPFYMDAEDWVNGYQFTLEFDPSALRLEDVAYGRADENTLGLYDAAAGLITASWYEQGWNSAPTGREEMFRLVFEVKAGATGRQLSELLQISSRYTVAEAYGTAGTLKQVRLSFGDTVAGQQPFVLYQNRPNPFKSQTVIGFELPEAGMAQLSVYDLSGRLLRIYEGDFAEGYNEFTVRRTDLNSGRLGSSVLYYRLRMGNRVATKKMMIAQ